MGMVFRMVIDVEAIEAILNRGNTAEIKRTKDGVLILEVSKKIRKGGRK